MNEFQLLKDVEKLSVELDAVATATRKRLTELLNDGSEKAVGYQAGLVATRSALHTLCVGLTIVRQAIPTLIKYF